MRYPGFKGMKVTEEEEELGTEEPYIFHFPDGNASVARLLVRALIPRAMPGHTMEDVVTARADYTALDAKNNPVRIRLNSTAVSVRHRGDPKTARDVEIVYVYNGKSYRVRGAGCVLACYNCMVPYLCPEMPQRQKDALAYAVKEPLVYTNVQLRNWKAFQALGTHTIYLPGSYWSMMSLDFPVSIGAYKFPKSPEDPCVVHIQRTPCSPGLSNKDQYRAGRWELYTTKFETYEAHVRDLFGRVLGKAGFDADRDIQAITVNRWPHGYAYEYNSLFEPLDRPEVRAALRHRAAALRAHHDRQFGFRRRGLHQCRHRSGPSRRHGNPGKASRFRPADCRVAAETHRPRRTITVLRPGRTHDKQGAGHGRQIWNGHRQRSHRHCRRRWRGRPQSGPCARLPSCGHDFHWRHHRGRPVCRQQRRDRAIGPAAIVSYVLAGILVLLSMRMLGELAIGNPEIHMYTDYPRKYLGHISGFVGGWLYWYFWMIVVAVEALAGAIILQQWPPFPSGRSGWRCWRA